MKQKMEEPAAPTKLIWILLAVGLSLTAAGCELCEMVIFDTAYVQLTGYPIPGDASDQRCGDLTLTIVDETDEVVNCGGVDTCTGEIISGASDYGGLADYTCRDTTCDYVFRLDPGWGEAHHVLVDLNSSGTVSSQCQPFEVVARAQTCGPDQLLFSAPLSWQQ